MSIEFRCLLTDSSSRAGVWTIFIKHHIRMKSHFAHLIELIELQVQLNCFVTPLITTMIFFFETNLILFPLLPRRSTVTQIISFDFQHSNTRSREKNLKKSKSQSHRPISRSIIGKIQKSTKNYLSEIPTALLNETK